MNFKVFGFQFGKNDNKVSTLQQSPIKPPSDESSVDYSTYPGFGAPMATVFNNDTNTDSEIQLINRYRELCFTPEVDVCIEEIVSDAIIKNDEKVILALNLDKTDYSDSIKDAIQENFKIVLNKLDFNQKAHDIFKRWYVDGRIYYQCIIDKENPKAGIQELRFIDPRYIKLVREIEQTQDAETGTMLNAGVKEYYMYNDAPSRKQNTIQLNTATQQLKLTKDSVAYANSGIIDANSNTILSYLHKAIRPATNLRDMEDSMLIYRLARCSERRIFYIDTGNLPKSKAEQYVNEIMNKFKSKISYDKTTGEIKADKRYMALTEDWFIPRKNGSTGTTIDTIKGGENIGETSEAEYFKDKLYVSLNVPKSRFMEQTSMFGSVSEVTRDELRFQRFIEKLRNQFNGLIEDLLGKQLVLCQVMDIDEWNEIKSEIDYVYSQDGFFTEAVDAEILTNRIQLANSMMNQIGVLYSFEDVFKKALKLNDEEIEKHLKDLENTRDLLDKIYPNAEGEGGTPQQNQFSKKKVNKNKED